MSNFCFNLLLNHTTHITLHIILSPHSCSSQQMHIFYSVLISLKIDIFKRERVKGSRVHLGGKMLFVICENYYNIDELCIVIFY